MAGHCLRLEKSISIHALREEGDFNTVDAIIVRKQFLSTPSARRATKATRSQPQGITFLSTPSARRATINELLQFLHAHISIHALREEGD